jgi:hypothetical protein
VVLLVTGIGLLSLAPAAAPRRSGQDVAGVVAVLDGVLRERDHARVELRDANGIGGGSVVLSRETGTVVVLTSGLTPPPEGRTYRCFLERGGERLPVGPMHFSGGAGYWAGPMGGPSDAGRAGDRFLVILDSATGTPALSGSF